MSRRRKWLWGLLGAVVLLLCLLTGVSIWRCKHEIKVTRYTVSTDLHHSVRIVQLTDLHNCVYGPDNQLLVELVAEQKPDIICMTGDMLNSDEDRTDIAVDLVTRLKDIAPVYFGHGNHEYDWMQRTGIDLNPIFEAAGATVLDCDFQVVTVCGEKLCIGGYHGYYRQPGMYPVTEEQRQAELKFADDFEAQPEFKLLLCHIPTAWLDWHYIDKFPVDLVLSGHYHGGQIRLPLLGGLYAPYVGTFPPYTQGYFQGKCADCILSTGLGSEHFPPRINNLPELVVIDLTPNEEEKG